MGSGLACGSYRLGREALQKMSFYKAALKLAKLGFHVFPVNAGGKIPAVPDFAHAATQEAKQLQRFWLDPVLGLEHPHNIGISTSSFGRNEISDLYDIIYVHPDRISWLEFPVFLLKSIAWI